jgi:hypothetical protein
VTGSREKQRFDRAVRAARHEWNSKRRRIAPFLDEDFTTIASCLLESSFWPFRDLPECAVVHRCNAFPCLTEFDEGGVLAVPKDSTCLWDFIHQLAHWCLPLEGHNHDFRSFYAALIEQALGKLAARSLRRAFAEHGLPQSSDWSGAPAVRPDFLHPFVPGKRGCAHGHPSRNSWPRQQSR